MSKKEKKKSKARSIVEWTLTIVFGTLFLIAGVAQIDGIVHRGDHFNQTLRFGWGSFVVLTDSMEPEYPVNSAIITHLDDPETLWQAYQAGQRPDVTFQNGAEQLRIYPKDSKYSTLVTTQAVFTHRIFEMRCDETVASGKGRYLFFVAGINTDGDNWKESQFQVFTEKSILGTVKANSPVLGGFFRIISSPWGLLIFLLVPAGYLVIVSVLDIFKTMKDPEEEKPALAGPGGNPEGGEGEAKPADADPLAGLSEEEKKRLKEELLDEMMKGKGK